jgi:hypothetical protein
MANAIGDDMGLRKKEEGRKVCFNGRVQFKTIRHIRDFSQTEIRDSWYHKKDYTRMSVEVSKIASMATRNQGYDGCTRGLEHLIEEEIADYRAEKMIQSVDAVLDEQEEQQKEDYYDPDLIARLYAEIAAPLLQESYLVALRDALDATAVWEQIADFTKDEQVAMRRTAMDSTTTQGNATAPARIATSGSLENIKRDADAGSGSTSSSDETCEEASTPDDDFDSSCSNGSIQEGTLDAAPVDDKTLTEDFSVPVQTPTKEQGEKNTTVEQIEQSPKKMAPPRKNRKNINRKGGTELSPLIRRLDGSFAFRNREKLEQKSQRKATVLDALAKHIDTVPGSSKEPEIKEPKAKSKKSFRGRKGGAVISIVTDEPKERILHSKA